MSDNHLHVSNTPIFDRLVGERGYDPKFPEHLTRPFGKFIYDLPVATQDAARDYMAPGAWIARPVPQISLPKLKTKGVLLTANIHPEEAEQINTYGMQGFIQARVNEFNRKHPNATGVAVHTREEADGTITVIVDGNELEGGGLSFAKKPEWPLPADLRAELKTDPIPEGMSGRQLALYKAATISSDTIQAIQKVTPEQTDEAVNAALTEDTHVKIPKPLWIADEEVIDEE